MGESGEGRPWLRELRAGGVFTSLTLDERASPIGPRWAQGIGVRIRRLPSTIAQCTLGRQLDAEGDRTR